MRDFTRLRQLWSRLPHRRAWHLAWPMILSNISVPLMGLADSAMLGHLDHALPLAGVALGGSVVALCYWMFGFLRMGTTSQTARALGAGDGFGAGQLLLQNSLLALGFGLSLIAFKPWFISPLLALLSADPNLAATATEYSQLRLFSAPAVLLTFVATGWLIALERTRAVLMITVSANLLNVALDYWLIVHWQLAARGAALATLLAEHTALLASLAAIAHSLRDRDWRPRFRIDGAALRSTLALNGDLFVRTLVLLLVINFFHAQGARFGAETLAANAILFQFTLFAAFFLDGYALAAETMVGQAVGRGSRDEFHRAAAATFTAAASLALALSTTFFSFGPWVLTRMSSLPGVVEVAHTHLLWLCLMPVISFACYALDGIYIGAGAVRTMRNSMLFSVGFGFFGGWWLLRDWGNHGLWASFIAMNALRGLSLGYDYWRRSRNGRWFNVDPSHQRSG